MPAHEREARCSIGLLGIMNQTLMMPLIAQVLGIAPKSDAIERMMECLQGLRVLNDPLAGFQRSNSDFAARAVARLDRGLIGGFGFDGGLGTLTHFADGISPKSEASTVSAALCGIYGDGPCQITLEPMILGDLLGKIRSDLPGTAFAQMESILKLALNPQSQ